MCKQQEVGVVLDSGSMRCWVKGAEVRLWEDSWSVSGHPIPGGQYQERRGKWNPVGTEQRLKQTGVQLVYGSWDQNRGYGL